MSEADGSQLFRASGDAYDRFMGRYSRSLAAPFADAATISVGQRVLDVGCGPGALTTELVARLGPAAVAAVDPSEPFVTACAARLPGVDVRLGSMEHLGFDAAAFDAALAQLVFHFVADPPAATAELMRVVRPGGVVAACVWDFDRGMEMLRAFWDAALTVDPDAPDEARTLRFGREGELVELFTGAGFVGAEETLLTVSSTYRDFDELWAGFLAGIGPAGAYCVALAERQRERLRAALHERIGEPASSFTMQAVARCTAARVAR